MANYLDKYIGIYRVKAKYDLNTNDIPRISHGENKGKIDPSYDDYYIDCIKGEIYSYGHGTLIAQSKSVQIGRNIIEKLKDEDINILWIKYYDDVLDIAFKAKDINIVAKYMQAKTKGANIRPLSRKNYPKIKYKISKNKLKQYQEIIDKLEDKLSIRNANMDFIKVIESKLKIDYVIDCKLNKCYNGQFKEYIDIKELWYDYIKFLKKYYNILDK